MTQWVDHDRDNPEWVEATQFGAGDRIKRQAFETAVTMAEAVAQPKITIPNVPWLN